MASLRFPTRFPYVDSNTMPFEEFAEILQNEPPERIVSLLLDSAKNSLNNLKDIQRILSPLFSIPLDDEGVHINAKNMDPLYSLTFQVPPAIEEILKDPILNKAFLEHLNERMCAENLQFWYAVERYRSRFETTNSLFQMCMEIYHEYIREGADKQINISLKTRRDITSILQEVNENNDLERELITKHLFTYAQAETINLLLASLPGFKQSHHFQKALDDMARLKFIATTEIPSLPDLTLEPLGAKEWHIILHGSKKVTFKKGEHIFDKSDYSPYLYILVDGELSVGYLRKEETLSRYELVNKKGSLLGEYTVLRYSRRSLFSAIVLSDKAELYRINVPFMYSYFKVSPSIGIRFFALLCRNMASFFYPKYSPLPFVVAKLDEKILYKGLSSTTQAAFSDLKNTIVIKRFQATLLYSKKGDILVKVYITKHSIYFISPTYSEIKDKIEIYDIEEFEKSQKSNTILTIQTVAKKMQFAFSKTDIRKIRGLIENLIYIVHPEKEPPIEETFSNWVPLLRNDLWKIFEDKNSEDREYAETKRYLQREIISPPGYPWKMIAVVIEGSCTTVPEDENEESIDLSAGDIEGAFSHFKPMPNYITMISSEDNTKVLFLNGDYLKKIFIQKKPDIALRLYYCLAKSICQSMLRQLKK